MLRRVDLDEAGTPKPGGFFMPVDGFYSASDTLLPVTTVSFTALQFNAVKKQFVAACKVPLP